MLVAVRAYSTVKYLSKVMVFDISAITLNIKTCVVIFFLICTAGEVVGVLKRCVEKNGNIFGKTYRTDISGVKSSFFRNYSRMNLTA